MKQTRRFWLLIGCCMHVAGLIALLCGCASVGKSFDESKVSQIKNGETTEADLVRMFGQPQNRSVNAKGQTTLTWIYTEPRAKGETYVPYASAFIGGAHPETRALLVALQEGKVVSYASTSGGIEARGTTQSPPSAQARDVARGELEKPMPAPREAPGKLGAPAALQSQAQPESRRPGIRAGTKERDAGAGQNSSGAAEARKEQAPRPMPPAARGETLWVIARGGEPSPQPATNGPGPGVLFARIDGQSIPMPLRRIDVTADISGYIGAVELTQQFRNPYTNRIEAVYVFPLPSNAAVNEFIMTIGERRIRAIIRERKEAERTFKRCRS